MSVWRNDLETVPIAAGYLAFMNIEAGQLDNGVKELMRLVEMSDGHYTEVVVRRLLGRALVEHGADDKDRQEGKRQLLHALCLARKMEFVVELNRIQTILDRRD